ncbi:MAG: hypothetical protein DLM50_00445 [Candidatus Meridianibacter frigidus]|nr:MAG: hypothetical protein DLM50_00445 [Candidatus Eremiobacteraeota bacterium]
MRYFFATGELSGETSAVLLSGAIRQLDERAVFEGLGSERMRSAGFNVWRDTRGWGSMGVVSALAKVPGLYAIMLQVALRLRQRPPDLVVLVDFGAFNLRLARTLRAFGYREPILYFFPPGAWLDNPKQARLVANSTVPLTPFKHQRDFYRSLGLPVHWFGHPLTAAYGMRAARAAPPAGAGRIAVLPGSRAGELRYHLPALLAAFEILLQSRPNAGAIFGAADSAAANAIRREIHARQVANVEVVAGGHAALLGADAAWIASGTAVLEAALMGVATVALYILSAPQARIARRIYRGAYITLPNIILNAEVIPEYMQEAATPQRLAAAMNSVLADPHSQYVAFCELRERLGPPDALAHCARFAVGLAGTSC